MSKIWGIPFPTNRGPKNHLFGRLRNLIATLMDCIFGTKRDIDNRPRTLTTTGVSYIVPTYRELWSTNGFKLEVSFHPPSVKSAFHFIARLRRWRSANRTQPHFAKRWTVGRTNNLSSKSWGRLSRKKWGPNNFYMFGFSTTSTLNGEYPLNEMWHRQLGKSFGKYEGSLRCHKISWTFVHKRLKTGLKFLLTFTIIVLPPPLHTLSVALTCHPTGTPDERHWVRLQLRFEAPKDVKLEMLSHRAALSGNTSL